MTYTVKFTDQTKDPIDVNDNDIDTTTSVGFPGRNRPGYAVTIAENFLHLLENFASDYTNRPLNPVEGQLWYDNSENVEELKVWDSNTWKPAGSLKKGTEFPTAGNIVGDIFVNTIEKTLYLFNGSNWTLVGPDFSRDTGAKVETLLDSVSPNPGKHTVWKTYVNNEIVSIFSTDSFIPAEDIRGFSRINAGINLSNLNSSNKFWGTSEKAENLIVGDVVVPSSTFLRSDSSNTTVKDFNIKSDSGLNIGSNLNLQLKIADGIGTIYYSNSGSSLNLNVLKNSKETTLVRLDSTSGAVVIGSNNTSISLASKALLVKGNSVIDGSLGIIDDTTSTSTTTGALTVAGGIGIAENIHVGNSATIGGQLTLSSGISITTNNVNNIGSLSNKFSNIYASTFIGNLTGNVTGNVAGNVYGSANKLIGATSFTVTGDITSPGFNFDGSVIFLSSTAIITGRRYKIETLGNTNFVTIGAAENDVGLVFKATGVGVGTGTVSELSDKVFETSLNPDFIISKDSVADTANDDVFLIHRPFIGLRRITKRTLVSDLALVPIGSILPFAGPTAKVPSGYLLCDGSEKSIGIYTELYKVVGFIYTPNIAALVGFNTFRLPDLRGRFPLGTLNMDNGDKVPNKTNIEDLIDSGGGTPDPNETTRATSAAATNLGNVDGAQQKTLGITNLPQHTHTLVGSEGGQYYAVNTLSTTPYDTGSDIGPGLSAGNQSQYLEATGNIDTSTVGQPFGLMNPFLTINYIIYTGVYL